MTRRNRQAVLVSILLVIMILVMIPGSACSPASSNPTIFAAAGAKPAIDQICQKFQEKYNATVEASYGGGGEVLSQMTLSRSGDIYLAPEQRFMEMAVDKQAIDPETVKTVAYMIPVVTVQRGNPRNIQTLADLARPNIKVAITRQETTLLGKYAPEIFAKAGLAGEIGKNIVTETVRPDNLLTMLVMGQIDAGIIWHFYQVQAPDQIENIYLLPGQLTGIGEMQAAVSAYSQDKKAAQRFMDFITSAEGKTVFKQLGYLVDAGEVKEYWH
ncbi:molybdate ABC transporter substrate-binding protein [Chloroflexota bacterium]